MRGSAPADTSPHPDDPHEFTLDPFAGLDAATADSLRKAAQAELERRIRARLAPADDDAIDAEARGWFERAVAPIERRRVQAELALRTDEILELLRGV